MIRASKNIISGLAEVQNLQARAQGMTFIESRIAESIGSAAVAKMISRAFGSKGITKEDKKVARETLRKKYGVDPDVEVGFGSGFSTGGRGGGSSKRVIKKLEDLKKVIVGMAESMTAVTNKIDAIGEQNKQILKELQGRVREEVGQIMNTPPIVGGGNEPPTGMMKTEGGIIIPEEKLKEIIRETIVEKPNEEKASESLVKATPEQTQVEAPASEPTAVPKAESEKKESLLQRAMGKAKENLFKRVPILGALSKAKEEMLPDSSGALSEIKPDAASLQPALEGIAEKKPISSQIEPDELQTLLKEALKDAFEELRTENPELFKAEGGGGGLMSMIPNRIPLPGRKIPASTAAKTGAKTVGKSVLKSALKKIPIVGAIAGLGFAASRAMAGDWTGAAMEAGSGLAGTVPGIGTAASVGIDAALAARDMGVMGDSVPPKPEPELSTAVPTSSGSEIIEMNRRIQSGEVSVRSTPNGTPIVQKIVNNNMMPKNERKENINVGNKENTFNRLIAQDFDHPSTYSNFNMG